MFSTMKWVAGAGLLAACYPAPPAATTSPDAPTTQPVPAELRNTRWTLRQLDGQPIPRQFAQEPHLLLRLDANQVRGHGGCNGFQGPFALPAAGQVRFGPLTATELACPDPTGATETRFLQALAATRTYRIHGDTLRLFGKSQTQPLAVLWAVYLR